GIMGLVLHLASMKSFDVPYLSSLTSLSIQGSKDTLLRAPWWQMKMRTRHLASKNEQRLQSRSRSRG
ncbi:MAG TPA: spore germination protein, partial [Firmicutes bacterium]|nr:spore germination protein [Bacillota bacterium]